MKVMKWLSDRRKVEGKYRRVIPVWQGCVDPVVISLLRSSFLVLLYDIYPPNMAVIPFGDGGKMTGERQRR